MVSGVDTSSANDGNRSGAIRLVRLSVPNSLEATQELKSTIGQYSKRFLESTVRLPFKYHMLEATAFLVSGEGHEDELDEYVISLQMRLREFLFGTQVEDTGGLEVLSFAGTMNEVHEFLSADPEIAFRMSQIFRETNEAENRSHLRGKKNWRYNWHTQTQFADERFRFRGILHCKQRIVIAHALTAMDMYGSAGFDDIPLGKFLKVREPNTIDFEITAFQHALERVKIAREASQPMVLFAPVTYSTLLSSDARKKYLAAVKDAPEWLSDHIGIMVFCGPDAPSFDAVLHLATDFKQYFRFMDWQVTSANVSTSRFMNSGLHTVTFDMHQIINDRVGEVERFGDHISDLRKMKIRGAITGIKTRDELLAAIRVGVSFVSGPFVTTALRTPLQPRQISPAELPLSDMELEPA
ncbi:hypothetical protein [Ponticaulis sp.]|uniref:hypothetical protein n=1 Tax=Ponticaulis sp. TaxID=2020902 RepID=UPI00261760AD|nr:hypothetical protein [Ponticaulis sp.]MDF1678998.1 hypothetical protein [Ponticaulis sp.]